MVREELRGVRGARVTESGGCALPERLRDEGFCIVREVEQSGCQRYQ